MSFIGAKQTIGPVTIPATTPGVLGYVSGIGGAKALLVRIRGGDNSTTNPSSLLARCAADSSAAVVSSGAIALTMVAGTLGRTNGDTHTSICYLFALSAYDGTNTVGLGAIPIPTPCVQLLAAMTTTASVGCYIDIWPIFDTPGRAQGGADATDLNTY